MHVKTSPIMALQLNPKVKIFRDDQRYRYADSGRYNFDPLHVGNFEHQQARLAAYSIFLLDEFDKKYCAPVKLKADEYIFRARTERSGYTHPLGFLVKINILKGLVYFIAPNTEDEAAPVFETRGCRITYMNLNETFTSLPANK
jgi:hypothetical protein